MAANEKLQLDISAKDDDASKIVDRLQKKVDQLETGETTVELAADTRDAESDVDAFAQKLSRLSTEDQVVLLSLKAGAAQTELTQLATELADLDASDPNVEVKLDRYAEVSGDLDQLQSKIKAIGETPVDAGGLGGQLGGVTHKLDGMRESADSSRSVLANMVGNSAQDLGALGGVAGTVGMTIGQLAEYATEGDIALSGLAKVAGPMAGVAAAVWLVNDAMSKMSTKDAFDTKQVDGFKKAILEGKDAVGELEARLKEAGKIELPGIANSGNPFSDAIDDVTDSVVKAGLTVEQYSKLVVGGKDKIQEWVTAQQAAGTWNRDSVVTLEALMKASGDYVKAQDAAKTSLQFFNSEQLALQQNAGEGAALLDGLAGGGDHVARAAHDAAAEVDNLKTRVDLQGAAMESAAADAQRHADAIKDDMDRQKELADSMRAAADATFDVDSKTVNFTDTVAGLSKKLAEAKGDTNKQKVAYDEVKQSAADLADAHVHLIEQTIAASGQTATATQKQDAWNHSLLDSAQNATPKARQAILEYIGQANQIPPEKLTELIADTAKGDWDGAQRLIDETSKARDVAVTVDDEKLRLSLQNADSMIKGVFAKGYVAGVSVVGPVKGAHAVGGTVHSSEDYQVVGERGPEIVELPTGSRVHTATESARMMGGASIEFHWHQEAPIYGVADLDARIEEWGRRIAQTIKAGRR